MSEALLRLLRPELRDLAPYAAASPERGLLRLHANEAPDGPDVPVLNRYPEPQPRALIARLAELYGVGAANALATRGSDDAIDLLVRCFCRAGEDSIAICPPTFGMYEVAARLQNAAVVRVPLDAARDFALAPDALTDACDDTTRIVFLCSPNNPTGGIVDAASVARLCEALRDRALVVLDEAYVEFSAAASLAPLVMRHDNLAVLRTLSKAFALAGARCGALIANPGLVEMVRPAMPPYSLPTPTVEAALAVLDERSLHVLRDRIGAIRAERERLRAALGRCPVVRRTWPSEGNFILAEVEGRPAVTEACRAGGILIRDMSGQPGLDRHVRITVGTPADSERLISILGALPGPGPSTGASSGELR